MKMSKQEVRDDAKGSGRQSAGQGTHSQAPAPDAQAENAAGSETGDRRDYEPTHFAIALRYDLETMGAPWLWPKGQDLVAKQIGRLRNGMTSPWWRTRHWRVHCIAPWTWAV
jgi:flagellar biosynthetic protein FlhB